MSSGTESPENTSRNGIRGITMANSIGQSGNIYFNNSAIISNVSGKMNTDKERLTQLTPYLERKHTGALPSFVLDVNCVGVFSARH